MQMHLVKAPWTGVTAQPAGSWQGFADALPDELLIFG
ncbi:hypothetical protein EV284_1094 [Streptomyces sp. BK022]|nr:hypothetical protein EV284_1094 [Streptomyces sp. BK022]